MLWRLLFALAVAVPGWSQDLRVDNAATPVNARYFAPGTRIRIDVHELLSDPGSVQVQLEREGSPNVALKVVGVHDPSVWVILPDDTPLGPAIIRLTGTGGSDWAEIEVKPTTFGIYTRANYGTGPATGTNSLTNPALPGDAVTLWGTGLGKVQAGDVWVELADQRVAPLYAGPAPGQPGLDQINFVVPAGAATGCYVPVRVRAAGVPSESAALSVSLTRGTCAHPLGLSTEQLKKLDDGWFLLVGRLMAQRLEPGYWPRTEDVFLGFSHESPEGLWSPTYPDGQTYCRWQYWGPAGVREIGGADRDAGPAVQVLGPGDRQVTLPESGVGAYGRNMSGVDLWLRTHVNPVPAFLLPGEWTLSAPGGTGIGAFQMSFQMPAPLQFLNVTEPQVIRRDTDLDLRWDGRNLGEGDAVSVYLDGPMDVPPHGNGAQGILCEAAAKSGRLVVPQEMLQWLPTSYEDYRDSMQVMIHPSSSHPKLFAAPSMKGGTVPVVVGTWVYNDVSITVK